MAVHEQPSTAEPALPEGEFEWHKVMEVGELPEGRVATVTIGRTSLAVTHGEAGFGCLGNKCPHQGGPLGEGSIEKGWLRCPWHGWDYSPKNGKPPGGFEDKPPAFRTEVREDGVYVALPVAHARVRTISDVMVETMVNWGVTHVFGMVGHSNLGFADAMREAEIRGDLTYIGIRHEGAASFAASAYGKLTGRLAGCFGIAGPGSTNLLTGLYDAKADRAPLLAISGQVPSKVRGRGAFQDTDLSAAFHDAARYSEVVHADSRHAELMNLACKTAIVERDVAHLVVPDEIQASPAPEHAKVGGPDGRVGSQAVRPPRTELEQAAELIAATERPLIIVGAGAREGIADVIALAMATGAPVATTFKAKGLCPDDQELAVGVMGRSGTPIASWFMNEADALVVFGASFSDHTGLSTKKTTIQVDRDPMALGRFHSVDIAIQADVGIAASEILEALPEDLRCADHREEVAERWAIWRDEKNRRRHDDRGQGINAAILFETMTDVVPADAVMPVDVGNNTYSFGRYFESKGQQVVMSGYLGSIGFAFPAAMGAWAAYGNDRPIVSVSGDGGFGQYAMELTTAVKYDMHITHVLLNNDELGKISKEQRAGEWDVWQTSLQNPNFAEFAELCGARGIRVSDPANLADALAAAIAHPGPALVEVMTDALLV
jgi:thiamine pyrophosphate-dependent acetolactate synthase large subunit-like protein/nitrite reductase/ring-hydroxylating ferredoxin subunit